MIGVWSCRTKPLTWGIWHYLRLYSVRIDLNYWTLSSCLRSVLLVWRNVGRRHWEDVTSSWSKGWAQQLEAPHPLSLCSECMSCQPFPQWEPFSRMQSWESNVLLTPSGWHIDWTPLRPLYKLTILAGRRGDLLVFWLPKATFICQFPCLLNLLPPDVECRSSFFSFSLPSMYRGQFANEKRKENLTLCNLVLNLNHLPWWWNISPWEHACT